MRPQCYSLQSPVRYEWKVENANVRFNHSSRHSPSYSISLRDLPTDDERVIFQLHANASGDNDSNIFSSKSLRFSWQPFKVRVANGATVMSLAARTGLFNLFNLTVHVIPRDVFYSVPRDSLVYRWECSVLPSKQPCDKKIVSTTFLSRDLTSDHVASLLVSDSFGGDRGNSLKLEKLNNTDNATFLTTNQPYIEVNTTVLKVGDVYRFAVKVSDANDSRPYAAEAKVSLKTVSSDAPKVKISPLFLAHSNSELPSVQTLDDFVAVPPNVGLTFLATVLGTTGPIGKVEWSEPSFLSGLDYRKKVINSRFVQSELFLHPGRTSNFGLITGNETALMPAINS